MEETKINQTNHQKQDDKNKEANQDINIEKFNELKKQLEQCAKEKEEYKEGWQRERASFENFKKNLENLFKDQKLVIKKEILSNIFEVVDSFYLALSLIPKDKKDDPFISGIYQIKARLDDFLKKNGLVQFGAEGEIFDPSLHEAVAVEKTTKKEQDGKIVKMAGYGFKLDDIVLRPAKVVIAQYQKENNFNKSKEDHLNKS